MPTKPGHRKGERSYRVMPDIPTPTMHPSLPDLTEARRRFTDLSTAERANLRFLARGWTPDEIARHRLVTLNTVRSQIKTMLRRLETDCTLRAVTIYHLARDPQWGLP